MLGLCVYFLYFIDIQFVSEKRANLFFCSVSVKYEPISIKTGKPVLGGTTNKTIQEVPTSSKIRASTTFGNLKWQMQIEPSTQYLHVHNYKHDWLLLSQKSSNVCSKSHHLYITCSKCLYPAQTKNIDAGSTSPIARLINSVIQTVHLFLMRRFSSTYDILVRAGGGHFEHIM